MAPQIWCSSGTKEPGRNEKKEKESVMETQSITTIISGVKDQLSRDISYIDFSEGSWCLTIHSVWCKNRTFQDFKDEIQISCNLSASRISSRNIAKTPIVVFLLHLEDSKKEITLQYFPPRRVLVNSKSSEIKFFLSSSSKNIPNGAELGIHFTLERFL